MVVQDNQDGQRTQTLQIESVVCYQIMNCLSYRQRVYLTWSRRLRSGVVRQALRYPEMMRSLNSNRSVFGQLSGEQLVRISRIFRNQSINKTYGCFEWSVAGLSFPLLESGFRPPCSGLSHSSTVEPSVAELQLSELVSNRTNPVMVEKSLVGDALQLRTQRPLRTRLSQLSAQRMRLDSLTGQSDQLRLKSAVDYLLLRTPKLYQRLQLIGSGFGAEPQGAFTTTAAQLLEQMEPLRNTVLRDNKHWLNAIQLVREELYFQPGVKTVDDQLDPVSLQDTADISVEQLVFGSIFPRVWRRAKAENTENDDLLLEACRYFNREDTLIRLVRLQKSQFDEDGQKSVLTSPSARSKRDSPAPVVDYLAEYLDIPQRYRDPCRFHLCVRELRQIDRPLNMHPRQFLSVLLETIVCVQLTVNVQTEAGIQQVQRAEQLKNCNYNVQLGADDMLPIFIYVLIRARLINGATAGAIMESCCDQSVLNDEYGYYLTCYQSALDFVMDRYKNETMREAGEGEK